MEKNMSHVSFSYVVATCLPIKMALGRWQLEPE